MASPVSSANNKSSKKNKLKTKNYDERPGNKTKYYGERPYEQGSDRLANKPKKMILLQDIPVTLCYDEFLTQNKYKELQTSEPSESEDEGSTAYRSTLTVEKLKELQDFTLQNLGGNPTLRVTDHMREHWKLIFQETTNFFEWNKKEVARSEITQTLIQTLREENRSLRQQLEDQSQETKQQLTKIRQLSKKQIESARKEIQTETEKVRADMGALRKQLEKGKQEAIQRINEIKIISETELELLKAEMAEKTAKLKALKEDNKNLRTQLEESKHKLTETREEAYKQQELLRAEMAEEAARQQSENVQTLDEATKQNLLEAADYIKNTLGRGEIKIQQPNAQQSEENHLHTVPPQTHQPPHSLTPETGPPHRRTLIIRSKMEEKILTGQEVHQLIKEQNPPTPPGTIEKLLTRENILEVRCYSETQRNYLQTQLQSNVELNNKLQIERKAAYLQKMILLGVPNTATDIEVKNHIIKTHNLREDELTILGSRPNNSKQDQRNILLLLPTPIGRRIYKAGGITLHFTNIQLRPYTSVPRCRRCQSLHHTTQRCNSEPICETCGELHASEECKNPHSCANCKVYNKKNSKNHPTNHKTSDPNCQTYRVLYQIQREHLNETFGIRPKKSSHQPNQN